MRGTTVILYEETVTGQDPFGVDIIEETPVEVKNVLIGEPSTDDITSSTQLYGGHVIRYMMGIRNRTHRPNLRRADHRHRSEHSDTVAHESEVRRFWEK